MRFKFFKYISNMINIICFNQIKLFQERLSAATKDILENFERSIKENTDAGSNSSSDIEYDGTNIPELNMDCDILSLIRSDKSKECLLL